MKGTVIAIDSNKREVMNMERSPPINWLYSVLSDKVRGLEGRYGDE